MGAQMQPDVWRTNERAGRRSRGGFGSNGRGRRLVRIANRRFLYGSSNRQITRAMTLRMKEEEVGVGSLSLRGVFRLSNALNANRFLRRGKAQLSGGATARAFRKALRRPSHEVPSRLYCFRCDRDFFPISNSRWKECKGDDLFFMCANRRCRRRCVACPFDAG